MPWNPASSPGRLAGRSSSLATPPALALSLCLLLLAAAGTPARAQKLEATVATGPNAFAIAINPVTNKVYVVSSNSSGSVTEIDGTTYVTTTVPVGATPQAIGINTATNKIYVANSGGNSVTVIDGATRATSTVAVGIEPSAIAVDSSTNKVYVVNTASSDILYGNVTVIDGATNSTTTIAQASNPGAIALDPAADKIFFLNNDGGASVTEIDGTTNATTRIGAVGFMPSTIAVNPVTHKIYVGSYQGQGITVIDAAANTYSLVAQSPENQFSAFGVNTVTNKIYAANDGGDGSVTVIDGATNATSVIVAGSNPSAVGVNPVTNVVYVPSLEPNGSVTVVDGQTTTTSAIAVGSEPFAVAVNPVTNKVFVVCNDANGTVAVIDGLPAAVAPVITGNPLAQTVNAGSPVVFSSAASGRPYPAFAWSLNGAPLSDGAGISGSSGPTLFIHGGATPESAGTYTCTVTNASGSATSTAATLVVVDSPDPGRIINLSTRAYVSTNMNAVPEALTAGFVIGGQGSKTLVLRGIGPALANFGIPDALKAPILSLYDASSVPHLVTVNAGWQNPPSSPAAPWSGKAFPADATSADFAQVGAFSLAAESADCAVKIALPAGGYTSQIAVAPYALGVALAEIYDADAASAGTQLINVSSRGFVAGGDGSLIAGFVITGRTAETVLIRASGPALAAFGVQATLDDPQLQLFDEGQNLIASNFAWGGDPQVARAAAQVGAFAWGNPSSDDSAVLVTLPPGSYTAQVSSVTGNAGAALVEVYLVQ